MPLEVLQHRLSLPAFLTAEDLRVLDALPVQALWHEPGEAVLNEKTQQSRVLVVTEGWAVRYKSLADGRVQILNFLLPGDIIGLFSVVLSEIEYGVEAITPMRFESFPSERLLEICTRAPRLAVAMSWIAAVDERVLDEQIVRVGRRSAAERLAHLCVELHLRLLKAGYDRDGARRLPLHQHTLAEALGMSHVHTHRSFRKLAQAGVLGVDKSGIVLRDLAALATAAGFDAAYLDTTGVPKFTQETLKR